MFARPSPPACGFAVCPLDRPGGEGLVARLWDIQITWEWPGSETGGGKDLGTRLHQRVLFYISIKAGRHMHTFNGQVLLNQVQ